MMCEDHGGVLVEIPTASQRGPDGNKRGIDACLAPLVKILNDAGIATMASCCGHGDRPGLISLKDGRELFIAPDFEAARRLDSLIDARLYTGSEGIDLPREIYQVSAEMQGAINRIREIARSLSPLPPTRPTRPDPTDRKAVH